jgi:hypothetical protein
MTSANDDARDERSRVGLCFTCRHASRIVSAHGSTFYLCTWSKVDPAFPRYPRLPVSSCTAFTPSDDPPQPA